MKAILLLILILVTFLYFPLNRQVPKFRLHSRFDPHIPLLPWTVWIYLCYYLVFPLSIILIWNTPFVIPYLTTQIISTTLATIIWTIFPNGVTRPKLTDLSHKNHQLLSLLYSYDKDCNGLPSGHVFHSFVACYFLSQVFPDLWLFFLVVLFAISLSTLTTKQHYFLDMTFSLLFTPAVIELTRQVYIISL